MVGESMTQTFFFIITLLINSYIVLNQSIDSFRQIKCDSCPRDKGMRSEKLG